MKPTKYGKEETPMDTQTCIRTRRSHRTFADRPVSRELVEQIVSLAAWAPSWKNAQICRYLAIEDQAVKEEIARRFCTPGNNNPDIITHCPVVVVQTYVAGRSGFNRDGTCNTQWGDAWQYFDCGVAAQTFCLAAHDLGLGSIILGGLLRNELSEYLQLPEGQELMALIALGWPDGEPAAPRRKETAALLSYR